jgi:hypothetical protein
VETKTSTSRHTAFFTHALGRPFRSWIAAQPFAARLSANDSGSASNPVAALFPLEAIGGNSAFSKITGSETRNYGSVTFCSSISVTGSFSPFKRCGSRISHLEHTEFLRIVWALPFRNAAEKVCACVTQVRVMRRIYRSHAVAHLLHYSRRPQELWLSVNRFRQKG